MFSNQAVQSACKSYRWQLFSTLEHGFTRPTRSQPARVRQNAYKPGHRYSGLRSLSSSARLLNADGSESAKGETPSSSEAEVEAIVRNARQTFGDTLPKDFLSAEEYKIYERLYGPPIKETTPEDMYLLSDLAEVEADEAQNVLYRENKHGDLEEVEVYAENISEDELQAEMDHAVDSGMIDLRGMSKAQARAMMQLQQDMERAARAQPEEMEEEEEFEEYEEAEEYNKDFDQQDVYTTGESIRAHPLTLAGRFRTKPSTLQLPTDTVTGPVSEMLYNLSNKHLVEVAERKLGGPGLPFSTALPVSKRHLPQKPVSLGPEQLQMSEMEGDVYMATIMPGNYAAITSALVEVRRRLGSSWLHELFQKKGGARMLDAGAGGAGVLAWREVLAAEWESLYPDADPDSIQLGRSTVVTGSTVLRHRASRLLDNTTFLPRLPDYIHTESSDSLDYDTESPQVRKQYDIIVAPHTLWRLGEDYKRKEHVENLWSLLNPNGGVLILMEKGLPRGFEAIAGARDLLLNSFIISPGYSAPSELTESRAPPREKEPGMIIAPCTNHSPCPLYLTPGLGHGRKDYCHFAQRYIRPAYYQRILGARDRNHEDVKFSYLAIRRGVDSRVERGIVQGRSTNDAAFIGHEDSVQPVEPSAGSSTEPLTSTVNRETASTEESSSSPHTVDPLTLPRTILPPVKRRGHVLLDVCTPAGTLERWTVPKSFSRQAYRDASKSSWGDLWALGAKTRVPRNIRVGTVGKAGVKNVKTKKKKGNYELESEYGPDGELEDVHLKDGDRRQKQKRSGKKGRKQDWRERDDD